MCFLLSFAPLGARIFCLCDSLAIALVSKINLCSFDRPNMAILYCLTILIKCAMFLFDFNPPFLALSPVSPVDILSPPAADHNACLKSSENTVSNVDFHP